MIQHQLNSLKRPFLSVSSDVFLEVTMGCEELVTAVIDAIERVSIVKPLMSPQPKNSVNLVKGILMRSSECRSMKLTLTINHFRGAYS